VLQGRRFAHELLRQAVLEGMPEALRAAVHGAWLRQAHDRLDPHARAAHAWAAGDFTAAVTATLDAARHDARRGLHDAASTLLTDTLARLPADDAQRAGLHAARAQVWMQQARLADADDEAVRALAELPEPAQRALALAVRADVALQQGRLADVPALVDEALAADPQHHEIWMIRVRWMHAQGDYAGGEALLREWVGRLRAERPGPDLVSVLTSLGSFIDFQGRHREALPVHREALALARRMGTRYGEVLAAINLLWCLPELGLHDEALAVGEQALALGDFDATPTLANNLAYLYLLQGRSDDAARIYAGLAAGPEPTLACVAQAKLLQIGAGRGDGAEVDRLARALLDRMAATEHAQAHAIAVLALLDHAPQSFRAPALARLPTVGVDTELQARLDAAVARARAA
jgi:tetratricopeptide (TPR) repeat protein